MVVAFEVEVAVVIAFDFAWCFSRFGEATTIVVVSAIKRERMCGRMVEIESMWRSIWGKWKEW